MKQGTQIPPPKKKAELTPKNVTGELSLSLILLCTMDLQMNGVKRNHDITQSSPVKSIYFYRIPILVVYN